MPMVDLQGRFDVCAGWLVAGGVRVEIVGVPGDRWVLDLVTVPFVSEKPKRVHHHVFPV